jgi:hypothetical protein
MDITVTFEKGHWITDPQMAIVMRGTKVRWIFRAPLLETPRLQWMVKFQGYKPLDIQEDKLAVYTKNTSFGTGKGEQFYHYLTSVEQLGYAEELRVNHRGVTPPVSMDQPGDYKYDVRVIDHDSGELIGEEDPWLFVVSPVFTANHIFLPR